MAAIGKLSPEQIERARELLQNLPEVDNRKTREEAAEILAKDFRKALKSYTPKQLSAMLKNSGIIIPAYLMEKYLKPEDENPRPKPKPKPRPAPKPVQKQDPKPDPQPAPEEKKEAQPVAGKFIITPDTPLEDL